jgi:hypothetical protein
MKCGRGIEKQQCYEHQGNVFCEDCYMDILSPPKACDPWAVRSAQTFLEGKDRLSMLIPLQFNTVNYNKARGDSAIEEMIEDFKLKEEE